MLTPVETAPADHVYVAAPDALRLAVAPAQIEGEFTDTTGSGFTVTVDTAVEEQPAVVPVTVYEVVVAGDTEIAAVEAPVDQE